MSDPITEIAAATADMRGLEGVASTPRMMPDASGGVSGLGPSSTSFLETLTNALGRADGAIASATSAAKAFAGGDRDISLSDVMVSLEQANLALQTAATIRDKVTAAYSNIMNMQV
jgi:flagellar hook-basal body complex protein FliE